MSLLLQQAVISLNLQPGQTFCTTINGQKIEVRVLAADMDSQEVEASDLSENQMIDLGLNVPPSPLARTMTVSRGVPIMPIPLELDESDLAPE